MKQTHYRLLIALTLAFLGLLAASFAGSFITVALGIGGGVLVLAIMATLTFSGSRNKADEIYTRERKDSDS